jgi:bloom syndrome protein
MALTSTANQQHITDIISRLKLKNPTVIRQSLNRPNLRYEVKPKRNEVNDLIKFINNGHRNHTGIIYRTGRGQCENLARTLRNKGITAKAYHAGLSATERTSTQAEWRNDECRVIVATVSGARQVSSASCIISF